MELVKTENHDKFKFITYEILKCNEAKILKNDTKNRQQNSFGYKSANRVKFQLRKNSGKFQFFASIKIKPFLRQFNPSSHIFYVSKYALKIGVFLLSTP